MLLTRVALCVVAADALRVAPGLTRLAAHRCAPVTCAASTPEELSESAEWTESPIAAAGAESAESLMQEVLSWLPDMLQGLEIVCAPTDDIADIEATAEELLCAKMMGLEGADDDPDDDVFVTVGRPWLHTAAFNVATGSTPGALGAAVWEHTSSSDFLKSGGGGGALLVLVPQLAGDHALFEKIGAAVAAAAKREINDELQVQACHPKAAAPAQRSPVPLFQLFADSPDLLVDG